MPQKFLSGRMPAVWQGGLIVLLVFLAYGPAWRNGFIWDDDVYVTGNPALHDLDGLKRIWLQIITEPQYYPMVHTTFWLEYHLWGLNPAGYHLSNILLHALASLLLWRVLLRLQIPGAWLGAIIFALHPVGVESVVWVTERKNVLSAVFYFAAALLYLHFAAWEKPVKPDPHRGYWYAGVLVLFFGALLSKTVTCTLPAALLLVCWWKKGRVRWNDLLPLLPLFAAGAGLGLMTAWIERYQIGAQGADWSLTVIERCLVAGRALWFYAGKLAWPADLTFIYPRWDIEPGAWWQWLFPVAAAGVVAGLWTARRRIGRGPLVAVLFFAVTLGPALGFINVYPMRYSFVADHFQYLASVGLITGCAWGLARTPRVISAVLILVLGALTWQQAKIYRDPGTLWSDTLAKNPNCSMAHNNLGNFLKDQGHFDEATEHYQQAVQMDPNNAEARYNLGNSFTAEGRPDDAIKEYRIAIRIDPDNPETLNNLGNALAARGRYDEAIDNFHRALQNNPRSTEALNNLGNALVAKGRMDEAIENYRRALQINPNFTEALDDLGVALAVQGRFDEAIVNFRRSIQATPNRAATHLHLAMALAQSGRVREAVVQYRETLKLNPDQIDALNNLAFVLAASSDETLRDGAEAVRLAQRACELTHTNEPAIIGTLAAAYAEAGRFPEAVATGKKAEQLAIANGQTAVAAKNRQLIELYQAGKPYHEPP